MLLDWAPPLEALLAALTGSGVASWGWYRQAEPAFRQVLSSIVDAGEAVARAPEFVAVILLGLTTILYVAALLVASLVLRAVLRGATGGGELRRVLSAVRRATVALLLRRLGVAYLATALTAAAVVGAQLTLSRLGVAHAGLAAATYAVLALLLGAGLATSVSWLSTQLGSRLPERVLAAESRGLARSLVLLTRGTGALALLSDNLVSLAIAAFCGVVFVIGRGLHASDVPIVELLGFLARTLPFFGVGGLLVSLVLLKSSGAFRDAVRLAASNISLEAGLDRTDARSPASVAELVALTTGRLDSRTLLSFSASLTTQVVIVVVGATLAVQQGPSALVVCLAALAVRGFGALAVAFGLGIVQTSDVPDVSPALLRSQAVRGLICAGALVGLCAWLFPTPMAWRLGASGLVALASSTAVALLGRQLWRRRNARAGGDSGRGGLVSAFGDSLFQGILAALAPLLATVFCLAAAIRLGAPLATPYGPAYALLFSLAAATALLPATTALAWFQPQAELGRGAGRLSNSALLEASRTSQRLNDLTEHARQLGQHELILTQAYPAVAAACLVPYLLGPQLSDQNQTTILSAVAVLGLAVLGLCVGRAFALTSRTSRTVSAEVERQLRVFPREAGVTRIPTEFAPSYRSCIELASRESARSGPFAILALSGLPLAVGVALTAMLRAPSAANSALGGWMLIAALASTVLLAVTESGRLLLGAPRRAAAPVTPVEIVFELLGTGLTQVLPVAVKLTALVALATLLALH